LHIHRDVILLIQCPMTMAMQMKYHVDRLNTT
jgi:hypothetical protein